MSNNTPRVWEITGPDTFIELHLKDHSSLDAISGQLPDGFYTTFRTYGQGTKVVGLTSHLSRLYPPTVKPSPIPACTATEIRFVLDRIVEDYRPQESRVRISRADKTGRLFLVIQPLILPPPEVYEQGVYVIITKAHRQTPSFKKTAFISESKPDRVFVASTDAYEGLIVRNQRILEGITSSFFYVMAGELGTAGRGVLAGVTRGEILKIARSSLSLSIRFKALRIAQVPFIQEAFICSSSREIVPVVQLDEVRIGSGRVGDVTQSLMQAYRESVMLRAESIV
jgi:branched-chain amino acid aminotransferase